MPKPGITLRMFLAVFQNTKARKPPKTSQTKLKSKEKKKYDKWKQLKKNCFKARKKIYYQQP